MSAPTPPLTDAELAEILEIYGAATPGPWEVEEEGEGTIRGPGGTHIAVVSMESDFACIEDEERVAAQAECEANARVTARARADVPRLAEEVRRLREVGTALFDALQRAGVALNEGEELHEEGCPCDDTCRCQVNGRIRAAVESGLRLNFDATTPGQRCAVCSHRHADPGGMGCAWCPCGHPVDCGCCDCLDARTP